MKRKKRLPIGPVVVGLGAVAVGAIVLAQTNKGRAPVVAQTNKAKTAPDSAVKIAAVPTRKPIAFYTGGVRNDLFNAPVAAADDKAKVTPVKTKPEPVDLSVPTTPVAVNPFSDYAYTGSVTANGSMVALIENTKTKEGQYLKQGDPFMGGKIAEVTDRTVTIDVAGKTESLAKTDDFKLTPLDKSAAYLTATPAQPGGPGAPGAPGGMPGMPGGAPGMQGGMAAGFMQRFQNMTPEQREQMQQRWMNRSFNGGGRGGNRRGGGGFGGGGMGGGFGGFGG